MTIRNGRPKVVSARIRDDGSFRMKLKKNREYSFVLYDIDGNPVLGIRTTDADSFLVRSRGRMYIQIGDKDNDGDIEVVNIDYQGLEPVETGVDNNNNGIPDNVENKRLPDIENYNNNSNYNGGNSNYNGNVNNNGNNNENHNYNDNHNYNGNMNENKNHNSNGNHNYNGNVN